MNITVYCASAPGDDPAYLQSAHTLGTWIGGSGHTLVYGGSNVGLMKETADSTLFSGGRAVGVTVDVPLILQRAHPHLTELQVTPDMQARKDKMMELADAYVALPGGPGTLDEAGDVLALAKLGLNTKPLVFFDTLGFYQPLKQLFLNMVQAGFVGKTGVMGASGGITSQTAVADNEHGSFDLFSQVLFSDDIAEIAEFLENKLAKGPASELELLEKARVIMGAGAYSCVVADPLASKDGFSAQGSLRILASKLRGVRPLLDWLDEGVSFAGAAAADRVVGNGAAFLYVLLGVSRVHAAVMSRAAQATLEAHGIPATADELVDRILNRTQDGFCPIETAVAGIEDPVEALAAIRNRLAELSD